MQNIINEFLEYQKRNGLSEYKILGSKSNINMFLKFYFFYIKNNDNQWKKRDLNENINIEDLVDIKQEHLNMYLEYNIKKLHYKESSNSIKGGDIKSFWEFLCNKDNRFKPLKHEYIFEKVEDRYEENYISDEEVKKLRATIINESRYMERDLLYIDLPLYCGLNRQEMSNLTIYDFNLVDKEIKIENRVIRLDLLNENIVCEIANYLDVRNIDGISLFGVTTTAYGNHVRKLGRRSGIKNVNTTNLRHTFVLNLYEKYEDLELIKNTLGYFNTKNLQTNYRINGKAISTKK